MPCAFSSSSKIIERPGRVTCCPILSKCSSALSERLPKVRDLRNSHREHRSSAWQSGSGIGLIPSSCWVRQILNWNSRVAEGNLSRCLPEQHVPGSCTGWRSGHSEKPCAIILPHFGRMLCRLIRQDVMCVTYEVLQ